MPKGNFENSGQPNLLENLKTVLTTTMSIGQSILYEVTIVTNINEDFELAFIEENFIVALPPDLIKQYLFLHRTLK